jgi:hypothetical protein
MKTKKYLKMFKSENLAMDLMRAKNRACKLAGNFRELFVVTDGPENNFAVMDLKSAIELAGGYKWEA